MKTTLLRSLLICGAFFCASPTLAQSTPLGLNFAEDALSYGKTAKTDGPIGGITSDFHLTDALGVQLDLSATSYTGGALGQVDAHMGHGSAFITTSQANRSASAPPLAMTK